MLETTSSTRTGITTLIDVLISWHGICSLFTNYVVFMTVCEEHMYSIEWDEGQRGMVIQAMGVL